jgi:protein ImuB
LLLRLDQALGIAREPRPSLVPPPEASSRLVFPEPLLTAEGVGSALEKLAVMLMEKLARQGLGARRFRLALYRADGTVAEAVVGTSMASRDPLHLQRLMTDRLSALDAGFGIDVVILEAGRLEPLEPRQMGLQAATLSPAEASAALVDRLVSRLGRTRVRVRVCEASHVPERAERWMPAMDIAKAGTTTSLGKMSANSRAAQVVERRETPLGHPARRPALLLSPPEPISVIAEIPEGAPQHFVWRRLARRIVKSEGPERIAPEWWRHIGTAEGMPGTRDYYRLEDATGARYWVFREGLYGEEESISEGADADADAWHREVPRWFVHGLFG